MSGKGSDAVPQNSSASGDVPAVSEVPRILKTLDLRLPLDRYLPSLPQVDQRSAAYRILTVRCLGQFDVHVMLPEPPTGVGLRSQNERRYGLTDAAAARLGYGLGERDPRAHADERQEAQDLKPRALAVLTGEGAPFPPERPTGGAEVQHSIASPPSAPPQETHWTRICRNAFLWRPFSAVSVIHAFGQPTRTGPRACAPGDTTTRTR